MMARGLIAYCVTLLVLTGTARADIIAARYADPTTRYDHGILGDAIEYGGLVMDLSDGRSVRLSLPDNRVFEDSAPRLADVDGDGAFEVIVVESDLTLGARLAIIDADGLVAATPFIGRAHRWLAPVGAADLDGDGLVELAYIDRPHLAKTLRVWRFEKGELTEIAALAGLTNHRIGETDIGGGIRDCGTGPEMIVASGDWRDVMAVRLTDDTLLGTVIRSYEGRSSFAAALQCKD